MKYRLEFLKPFKKLAVGVLLSTWRHTQPKQILKNNLQQSPVNYCHEHFKPLNTNVH